MLRVISILLLVLLFSPSILAWNNRDDAAVAAHTHNQAHVSVSVDIHTEQEEEKYDNNHDHNMKSEFDATHNPGNTQVASGSVESIRQKMASEALRAAKATSSGWCAKYVHAAINRAGIRMGGTNYAKNFGPLLIGAGFKVVGGSPQIGDVRVIQSYPGGNPAGHMEIYTHGGWVSDFRQSGEYPGPGYRKYRPAYKQYRYKA